MSAHPFFALPLLLSSTPQHTNPHSSPSHTSILLTIIWFITPQSFIWVSCTPIPSNLPPSKLFNNSLLFKVLKPFPLNWFHFQTCIFPPGERWKPLSAYSYFCLSYYGTTGSWGHEPQIIRIKHCWHYIQSSKYWSYLDGLHQYFEDSELKGESNPWRKKPWTPSCLDPYQLQAHQNEVPKLTASHLAQTSCCKEKTNSLNFLLI